MRSKAVPAAIVVGVLAVLVIGAVLFYRGDENGEGGAERASLSVDTTRNETASSVSGAAPVQTSASLEQAPTAGVSNEALAAASPADLQRLKVLNEILASGSDNDPRLDSEFRNLTPASKKLMKERYQSLPPERLNERGTIAFLLGREIASAEDVAFLGGVLGEAPCLSLGDCSQQEKHPEGEHVHHESGAEVTLNYPKMVTLQMYEKQIQRAERGEKLAYLAEIRRYVEEASRSPIPIVSDKAQVLLERLSRLKS